MDTSSLIGTLIPLKEDAKTIITTVSDDNGQMDVSEREVHLVIQAPHNITGRVFLCIASSVEHMNCEIFVEDGSVLQVVCMSASDVHITQRAQVGADAHLHVLNVSLGSHTEQDLESRIIGAHGTSDIDWIFYVKGNDQQKISAENVFLASHGGGEITLRGVAEGAAHAVSKGLIKIGEKGGGTDTYLTEEVLMLDPTAKVDAIPGLEIKTNDVKASHSATVAKITAEDLFYLASRGIDERIARSMFVLGFLQEPLARLEAASVQDEVRSALERKFDQ